MHSFSIFLPTAKVEMLSADKLEFKYQPAKGHFKESLWATGDRQQALTLRSGEHADGGMMYMFGLGSDMYSKESLCLKLSHSQYKALSHFEEQLLAKIMSVPQSAKMLEGATFYSNLKVSSEGDDFYKVRVTDSTQFYGETSQGNIVEDSYVVTTSGSGLKSTIKHGDILSVSVTIRSVWVMPINGVKTFGVTIAAHEVVMFHPPNTASEEVFSIVSQIRAHATRKREEHEAAAIKVCEEVVVQPPVKKSKMRMMEYKESEKRLGGK